MHEAEEVARLKFGRAASARTPLQLKIRLLQEVRAALTATVAAALHYFLDSVQEAHFQLGIRGGFQQGC